MKNIAIYGGAFDPPHKSHINLIKALSKMINIDEVWLLPCGDRNDKKLLLSKNVRFDLMKRIFTNDKKIKVINFEIQLSKQKGRMIQTYQLLKQMQKAHTQCKFHFTIGADILQTIDLWGQSQKLKQEFDFIIFHRKGYEIKKQSLPPKYKICQTELDQVSSSFLKKVLWDETLQVSQKIAAIESFVPSEAIETLKNQKVLL